MKVYDRFLLEDKTGLNIVVLKSCYISRPSDPDLKDPHTTPFIKNLIFKNYQL